MNNRNTMGVNLGAATAPAAIADESDEVEDIFLLRFGLRDELGQPIKGIPYKTLPAGQKEDLHKLVGKTNVYGKTFIASTEQGERIDIYIARKNIKMTNIGQ